MKRTIAFLADNQRVLHHTARDARCTEFDELVDKINFGLPSDVKLPEKLARTLRMGVYGGAANAFLEAAKYLEQHYAVLTGSELDPEERKDDE